jgi:hypothetical protein
MMLDYRKHLIAHLRIFCYLDHQESRRRHLRVSVNGLRR